MNRLEKKVVFDKLDLEKTINDGANNNITNENSNTDGQDLTKQRAVQCLLKDDKVFSLNWMENAGWSVFMGGQWNKKNCKFVTGTVILNKDWSESKLSLQIRWENGNIEKLRHKSTDIAHGDRVFVMDRQCISPGSKVFLIEHPELEGTVTAKRYLATGITTSIKAPDLVFEDIDVNKLRRDRHGSGYKDIKILYRGWLGVTSGYRTRVFLQAKTEDVSFFSIVVDGNVSQNFNIGDDINLGFRILRGADFVGEDAKRNNWLANFFKFYNTTATVVDFEIDQLLVCWIGKASAPNALPNHYDLPDAPDDLIPYDQLCHVQYLLGENHNQMTTKSLWVHECSSQDHPLSKENWCKKWLKLVDWDRWEYPENNDENPCIQSNALRNNRFLTLEIMYIRSIVDVRWSNGSSSTVNSGDVIPVQIGSVWSDMMRFQVGSIVRDHTKTAEPEKYGIITCLSDDNCATVHWIWNGDLVTCNEGKSTNGLVTTASLYNLTEKAEYDFISKVSQCPIVNCGNDKIGVVVGISSENHKTLVKMVDRTVEHYWPHEITHYNCDVLLCPIDNRWTLWYEHLVPPSGIMQVGPEQTFIEETPKQSSSSVILNVALSPPKRKFECKKYVPRDNIFVGEDIILPTRETAFYQAMEHEISEMEKNLPDGMWVEHYMERGDIFSAVVTGPKDSMFEDFIFIFDLFLMEDFPKSEPHINFRSMGVTLIPGHLCKTGAVFLPEETRLLEEDFSFSYILNLLLEMKDFMGIPLEFIHEKNSLNTIGVKPEDPEELYKFVALSVLDYSLLLLQNPPRNWRSVINNHFLEALPRILQRFKRGEIEMKRPLPSMNNEKGDSPKPEQYEVVRIPWNEKFMKSVNSRILELEKIYARMQDACSI